MQNHSQQNPSVPRKGVGTNGHVIAAVTPSAAPPDVRRSLTWDLIRIILPQEINKLSSSIYLSLPGVLALPQDCCSQELEAIFSTNQIRCFQKDRSSVGKRQGFPCWFSCNS